MRAFLDIDIGDRAEFERESAAFERAAAFLAAVGAPQLGLPGSLADLDEEGASMLLDAYAADKTWSAKGPARIAPVAPLRAGRLVIELFEKDAPKAAENFRCLVTGEKGLGKASKKPMHYKGVRFHRIVKGFCMQGGDIVRGDGSGGDSIYGGKFNDDKGGLALKHGGAGAVAMANSGKNSNTSQFYVTLGPAPQADGKHVVFGRVVEGIELLARVDAEAASEDGTPRVSVVVGDCGVL